LLPLAMVTLIDTFLVPEKQTQSRVARLAIRDALSVSANGHSSEGQIKAYADRHRVWAGAEKRLALDSGPSLGPRPGIQTMFCVSRKPQVECLPPPGVRQRKDCHS
jgi:hypothetical protein